MIWLSVPLLALAAAAQATFMPQIRILDGQPDLVFLLVLAWSIHATAQQGLVWAVVGGLFVDLLSAAPLGTTTLGLGLVILLLEGLRGQLARVGVLTYISLVLVGSFVVKLAALVVIALSGFSIAPVETFTRNILPSVAYNLAFMLPVYVIVRLIQRRVAPVIETARAVRTVSDE